MRLINIDTLRFEEHIGDNVPPYAILSHRWTDDEISFPDYRKGRRKDSIGYQKVLKLSEVTRSYNAWLLSAKYNAMSDEPYPIDYTNSGKALDQIDASLNYLGPFYNRSQLHHVWIDTCCIDKRSSAELSEAINSMFSWYEAAQLCIVYLTDFTFADDTEQSTSESIERFQGSEWFTRGWTLQELLASSYALFYDARWQLFGHKCHFQYKDMNCTCLPIERHLNNYIATACAVDVGHLDGPRKVTDPGTRTSAATVFSWASCRRTTRVEDEAYCLLGLLGINMPLLYGEGRLAFRRLQQEVIREHGDLSVLACYPKYVNYSLAGSPADFALSRGMTRGYPRLGMKSRCIVDQGVLEITAPARDWSVRTNTGGSYTVWLISLDSNMLNPDKGAPNLEVALLVSCVDNKWRRHALATRPIGSWCAEMKLPTDPKTADRFLEFPFYGRVLERVYSLLGWTVPLVKTFRFEL